MKNQLILVSITLLIFLAGGILIWYGVKPLGSQFQKIEEVLPSPDNPQILGEQQEQVNNSSQPSSSPQEVGRITRVVDGDTVDIDMSGVKKKLRYIGVNTPETVDPRRKTECFGKEASNENKRLVEGREVVLERDVSETDRFGRLLRYVYLKLDDGSLLFVNDYLVRQGYAYSLTYPPDVKYSDRFVKAQQEARDNNRGLWASCS